MQSPQHSAVSEFQQLLASPPPANSQAAKQHHNPIAIAHAHLQALRDAGDAQFLFARCILELSSSQQKLPPQLEELLFHCLTGCRHVMLTKWNARSTAFRRGIRDFLLAWGLHQQALGSQATLSRTLRLAYLNAAAAFWKRNWVEELKPHGGAETAPPLTSQEQSLLERMRQQQQQYLHSPPDSLSSPRELFQYLERWLLRPQWPFEMLAAASFFGILLGEFAGKSSANYQLPLEFHKQAHAAFELASDGSDLCPLNQCLQWSLTCLSQLVPQLLLAGAVDDSNNNSIDPAVTLSVVQLTIDVIGWEWGTDAWDSTGGVPAGGGTKALVRPPASWRELLLQPDFVKAIFQIHAQHIGHHQHQHLSRQQQQQLSHGLRQLLLLLASLTGPMFQGTDERKGFAKLLLEGLVNMMSTPKIANAPEEGSSDSLLLDTLTMMQRLFVNYKLSILVQLPEGLNILQGLLAAIGRQLLQENLQDLQSKGGDLELMDHRDWREEALALLVDGVVMLCGDPWLLYSGSETSRQSAQATLASTLGPLYLDFVTCRTQMARLEEMFFTAEETELDEVREEIVAVDLEEEMTSLANLGRLDLGASLNCLAGLFQQLVPQLQALWNGNVGVVTPQAAGMLEESRLVTIYVGHLLTDDNDGETPVIPDTIMVACARDESVSQAILGAVQTLQQFAQFQASKIAVHPGDPRLSPLLSKSFLWFLHRWAPAYILPVDYGACKTPSSILKTWASPESVQESVSFVVTLCLHYHCYWPHEPQVQENAAVLLHALAKRCPKMRLAMIATPSFQQLISYHCLTCGIRHSAPPTEFESTVRAKAGNAIISLDMLRGYQRLPYSIKARLVTALLVGCSDHDDERSKNLLNDCLKAIHEAFSSLVHVLSTKQTTPDNVDAKEMASLCVELYGGVARAGEMVASERIPSFLTPSLPHLSGLMSFYAEDLSICESLLQLFRDYAEQFIAVLDPESCLALFQASGELLKSYSAVHCNASKRVITMQSVDEEQSYTDILCAIQLLIQLGTKDFIDVGESGMDSSQVTDMIFFGLQQILPLMTRGLLQFPTLCSHYFSLVGFMMETYPEKVGVLPYELLDALLESLLFGMSHHDANTVAKSSLQGLAGIVKEHLKSQVLNVHLAKNPALLDKCCQRLLTEVVFQTVVWDRLEATGLALLPLAAVDLSRFANVVQVIVAQQIAVEHQSRLSGAFERLLIPEILGRATDGGYEGRQNRIKFKKDFQTFCHEIHSFLVIK